MGDAERERRTEWPPKDTGLRTRHTDRGFHPRDNWHRDLWLLVITGLVLFSLHGQSDTLHRITQGRRVALGVTCATTNAIVSAGRAVISGSVAPGPTKFERALEALGYPPRQKRRREARIAAQQYAQSIALAVEGRVGRVGDGLVRRDGTLDCTRLSRITRA